MTVEILTAIFLFCQAPRPAAQHECNKVMVRCVNSQFLRNLDGTTDIETIRTMALAQCVLNDGKVQEKK